jgi:hypothetical protein
LFAFLVQLAQPGQLKQAILVSTQICFVHCMAEGARMTLILAAMSHEGNQNFEFLVPIVSGMVWNIAVPWLVEDL